MNVAIALLSGALAATVLAWILVEVSGGIARIRDRRNAARIALVEMRQISHRLDIVALHRERPIPRGRLEGWGESLDFPRFDTHEVALMGILNPTTFSVVADFLQNRGTMSNRYKRVVAGVGEDVDYDWLALWREHFDPLIALYQLRIDGRPWDVVFRRDFKKKRKEAGAEFNELVARATTMAEAGDVPPLIDEAHRF